MSQARRGYLAVYGNIKMKKLFCEQCQQLVLIVKRKYACCGKNEDFEPEIWKRECDADGSRSRPAAWLKKEILEQQENRCLYCERMFHSWVHRKKKAIRLTVCWDHFSPYSYSRDNGGDNFVAACQVCNGLKSNKIFETLEEARIYLATCERFDDER